MGAASCSKSEIEDFASFVNNFHLNLKFTWSISEEAVSFLDLCIKPSGDRLTTTIHYKETDTQSYLNYFSSHPVCCKAAEGVRAAQVGVTISTEEGSVTPKSLEIIFYHRCILHLNYHFNALTICATQSHEISVWRFLVYLSAYKPSGPSGQSLSWFP